MNLKFKTFNLADTAVWLGICIKQKLYVCVCAMARECDCNSNIVHTLSMCIHPVEFCVQIYKTFVELQCISSFFHSVV